MSQKTTDNTENTTCETPSTSGVDSDLTYAVIGCAQTVHKTLGPGLIESVYRRALCHELSKAGVKHQSEVELEVVYDGLCCGRFRLDLLVEDRVVVELKAVEALHDQHKAQTLCYLKASGKKVALLMNFGELRLKVKRFVN